jgi:hypothetical protein
MKSTSSVPPALLHSLLSSVVQFMSTSGVETGRIERSFRASMRAVTAQRRATADRNPTSINIGSDSVAGAVLRAWHRDAAYVDEGAQPRPLRLAGRSPSLTALVRRQDAKCDVSSLIRDLLTVGLVRKARNGRYLPTAESATIGQLHPLAVEHVAKSTRLPARLVCESRAGRAGSSVGRLTQFSCRRAARVEGSCRRWTLAIPCGSRCAAAACTRSGAGAGTR